MSIEIREVLSKKDLKTWVRFPNKLYAGNAYFVPFLENSFYARITYRLATPSK